MIVTRTEAGLLMIDFDFHVPIPSGHDVLLVEQTNPTAGFFQASQARCAVDRTARLVYADYSYWDFFKAQARTAHPADEPNLGEPWQSVKTVLGVSLGGVMSSKDGGEQNHACTRLYVRPHENAPGYRG